MNQMFKEELYDFLTIFLDDVFIYSQNLEEHLKHLKITMQRLASAGIKLKPSKCKLIQRAVSSLGYHIGADGIWPDEGKLQALSKWSGPLMRPRYDQSLPSVATTDDLLKTLWV